VPASKAGGKGRKRIGRKRSGGWEGEGQLAFHTIFRPCRPANNTDTDEAPTLKAQALQASTLLDFEVRLFNSLVSLFRLN